LVFVPFDSVEWDFGDETTLVSRSNQVKHRYAEPGTYCVKANVKLPTGNIRTEDSVTIYKSPNLHIGSDTLLCTRENSLKLNIPSYDSMLWSTGSLDSFIEITNSGSYSVTVIENECSSTDSINVYMIDCEVSYAGLCRGDTTFCQYNIEVDSALHRYERGSVESNKNFYAYTLDGTFYPQCTVFKNGLSKVVSDTLIIYNRPKAYLGQDTIVCNPIYLKNLVRSTDVVQTTWNHSFIGDSLKVLESGLFTVSVSHHGCVAEDTIFVSLEHCNCTLFIPNAFTPNGNYLNEVFKPISDCDIEYSMEI
jgi:PKD repeat protein